MASNEETFLNSDTISDEFFIDIVSKKLNIPRDQIKLRLVLLSPAIGKGENYYAALYRAKIKIEVIDSQERKSIDVIIKAVITINQEAESFTISPRERIVYVDVLESLEKIWRDRTGEGVRFSPRCIKFETDPYNILVLDDLKVEDYEMLNRKVGLDKPHTEMLLSRLARFHAASAVRFQEDGIVNQQLDRKFCLPPMPKDSPMEKGFTMLLNAFGNAVRGYGGCEVYADKIAKWDKAKYLLSYIDVAEPMQCGFQILNHGDMWLNNIMFKSDGEGKPTDVRMLDYQFSFWASPSYDLLCFMITSPTDDIKIDHFDDFVKLYHDELVASLKSLNYDQRIPTLAELHDDLLEKGFIGWFLRILLCKLAHLNIFLRSLFVLDVHPVRSQK